MNQRERVRLLFGPYRAQPLKKGDRATCLLRDCTVVITSWTDARISWPRCRSIDTTGGSGLLVDEELARAVQHEAAAAIMHWWGVGVSAVCHWRKVLGVGRADPEGSRRLIQAAAEEGAAATRAREWTNEERERCRQTTARLGQAAYLPAGYHESPWSEADVALLGQLPDEEVARRLGRSANAVRLKREKLGIVRAKGGRWRDDELALLGTVPDQEVARRLERSPSSVIQKRCKLGIPTFRDGRHREDGS